MDHNIASFRHAPLKSVLRATAQGDGIRWDNEPAVTGYRRLTYHNQRLNRELSVPVSASPAVIKDVGVVVAADDGYVRMFGVGLEKVFWERRVPASVYASLVVDPVNERVIVATTSGDIAAFDLRGNAAWICRLERPVFATPALHPERGLLAVSAFGHKAVGVNISDGSLCFVCDLPQPWHAAVGGKAAFRNPYASPAFLGDGNSIHCSAQSVVCLSPNGVELWRTDLPAEIKASPVVVEGQGVVAITTVAGVCHLLELINGKLQTSLELGDKVTSSGALQQGMLALGLANGRVACIDLSRGEIAWEATHGAPRSYTSFTLTPSGDFIATSKDGNIICRNAMTGKFLWESTQVMGLPDHEPSMDITPVASSTGRMYCASYNGDLYEFSFQRCGSTQE